MERGRSRFNALLVLTVVLSGCLASPAVRDETEPVDLRISTVSQEPPVEPQPLTGEMVENVPEFRSALDEALKKRISDTDVRVSTSDAISQMLDDSSVYSGGASGYRPNGTYLSLDTRVVLVRTDEARREVLVRSYPSASSATVNRVDHDALRDQKKLWNLTQTALEHRKPISRSFDEESYEELSSYLQDMDPHRPGYNDESYWGHYVRYRDETLVVSQRFDTERR